MNNRSSAMLWNAAFGLLGAGIGILLATDSRNSDPSLAGLCLLLFILYGIFVLVLLIAGIGKRLFAGSAIAGLIAFPFYQGVIWLQCPRNIRFEFSNPGNTGTYQAVQFYHEVSGQWLKGPSAEGWPLTVSFPDIDHDGYPDIRVVESQSPAKGVIEFLYVPNPADGIYWKAGKMDSGLSAGYPPAKIFYHYP